VSGHRISDLAGANDELVRSAYVLQISQKNSLGGLGGAPLNLNRAHMSDNQLTRDDDYVESAFVYAITDGKYVKVGWAKNIQRRKSLLQCGNANPLRIIGRIGCTCKQQAKDNV